MRLIRLTANQASFRTVLFNERGPTYVVGAQEDRTSGDTRRTYNGVGKSLMIALIHFCLGSNKRDGFEGSLEGWEFTLEFSHDGGTYHSMRSCSDQSALTLNGERMTLSRFRDRLGELVFNLRARVPNLTFRSLLANFIRSSRASYSTFDEPTKGTPYQHLLRMSYLLGLDIDLVLQKYSLRTDRERIRKLKASLEKDPIFAQYFGSSDNADIELQDLHDEIARLQEAVDAFRIAEDYQDRQAEANALTRRMQAARNEIHLLESALGNIEASLRHRPDVSAERLRKLYEEASRALPELVIRRIEEVVAFQRDLAANRVRRLTAEKEDFDRRMSDCQHDLLSLGNQRDGLLAYLGSHGALDELLALQSTLGTLRSKAQQIQNYKGLLDEYSNQLEGCSADLSNESIKANTYLASQSEGILMRNMNRFRFFSKRFYGDRPGGLVVENNTRDNQIRFNISARIQDDASDGINEVKIFCFDMTVLTERHNHSLRFVIHDSRLFSDIDIRQRATLFRIAHEVSHAEDVQYIATLNQDQIDGMRGILSEGEVAALIDDCVTLRLTDESPEAKLLGRQIDMMYEETALAATDS